MILRADEFSLHLQYRKPNEGSYPRPAVQGFHLFSHFCDGGNQHLYSDSAPGTRLDDEAVLDLAAVAARFLPQGRTLVNNLRAALVADKQEKRKLLEDMKARQAVLAAKIAELEKDVQ
jgi:hypothetical protein